MYVILVYDIYCDDESAKVQRKVFSACKKYLVHIQKSVFEGNVTKPKLLELEYEIKKYIRPDRDSVLVFVSIGERWLEKRFWAKIDDATSRFI